MKKDILSLTLTELSSEPLFFDLPKFRARQIYEGLHKQCKPLSEITNIPKDLIKALEEEYYVPVLTVLSELKSKIDGTVKFLFEFPDKELCETVLLRSDRGLSVCVSTEIGCKMGCRFCASTKAGFKRKLTCGEILSQVYYASRYAGERIGSVMLMGIGEPLDNFDEVIKFLDIITNKDGMNLSPRHISVSTCGLVPEIRKLSEIDMPITLSISLHAPFDTLRSEMMPINDKYPISDLLSACDDYLNGGGKRISVEYTVIDGKNNTDECALELKRLFGGKLYHINLIPLNEIKEKPYLTADKKVVYKFCDKLESLGLNATVRRSLGSDISAACGQLRRNKTVKE